MVRSALRAAREGASTSQGAAAKKLDWSLSKVQRIESGEVTVSSADLRAALVLYGAGPEQIEYLVWLARMARRRVGPWHEKTMCHLDSYTMELVQFEHDATLVRWCESGWVPDPLHTDTYAAARLAFLATELSAGQCTAHAAASRLRRDLFTRATLDPTAGHTAPGRSHRPRYQVVLDESVIHRPYGGYAVLREQLEALLDQVRSGDLELRIVTYASANPLAASEPFLLIDIDHQPVADPTVLALHHGLHGGPYAPVITTDAVLLAHYRRRWEKLWATHDPVLTEQTLLHQLDKIHRRLVRTRDKPRA